MMVPNKKMRDLTMLLSRWVEHKRLFCPMASVPTPHPLRLIGVLGCSEKGWIAI